MIDCARVVNGLSQVWEQEFQKLSFDILSSEKLWISMWNVQKSKNDLSGKEYYGLCKVVCTVGLKIRKIMQGKSCKSWFN